MNSKWYKHAEGFTLLEVMIALSIIALTLVTYVHSQNTSMAFLNESTNVTVATLLAQRRMIMLEGSKITGSLEREGIFEDTQYEHFRWQYEHFRWKERVVSTPLPNILEAHVEVFWDDNRGLRSVELISLVIRQ